MNTVSPLHITYRPIALPHDFLEIGLWPPIDLEKYCLLQFPGDHICIARNRPRFLMCSRDWCPSSSEAKSELKSLTRDVLRSLNSASKIAILAAFHIRFLSIHPLTDGNGRTARALLSCQSEVFYGIPANETMQLFCDYFKDYRMVFVPGNPIIRFSLMASLLAIILGQPEPEGDLQAPFPLVWSKFSQISHKSNEVR